LKLRALFYEI